MFFPAGQENISGFGDLQVLSNSKQGDCLISFRNLWIPMEILSTSMDIYGYISGFPFFSGSHAVIHSGMNHSTW